MEFDECENGVAHPTNVSECICAVGWIGRRCDASLDVTIEKTEPVVDFSTLACSYTVQGSFDERSATIRWYIDDQLVATAANPPPQTIFAGNRVYCTVELCDADRCGSPVPSPTVTIGGEHMS